MYDESNPACPNCNAPLSKVPYSKSNCPYCGKIIYIRVQDGTRFIVNEHERKYIDEEREKARNRRYYINAAARGAAKGCLLGLINLLVFGWYNKR